MRTHDPLPMVSLRIGIIPVGLLLCMSAGVFGQAKQADDRQSAPAAASADGPESETESLIEEATAELPLIDRMPLPTFERLMKGPPVDWLVMRNRKVLTIEPLYPRPGTIDDLNQKISRLMRKPTDPPETEAARRKRLAAYYLPVTLSEGED